jgi:hypothetical protein
MNWDRIAGSWKQLKGIARQQRGRPSADGITRQAKEKQLAEWLARQHKIDPIYK